jgi:hypothetical protein
MSAEGDSCIASCLTATLGQHYSAFEVTMTGLSKSDRDSMEKKLAEMHPESICGLRWQEGSNYGLKATIEFDNQRAIETIMSISGIGQSNVEGVPPDTKWNMSAHDRIHGKLEMLMEEFEEGRVHPLFAALGITRSSSAEAFCSAT